MQFFNNTDTVDIDNRCIGVHCFGVPDNVTNNRGLGISIRHNGDKAAFELANEMARVITEALNTYFATKQVQS